MIGLVRNMKWIEGTVSAMNNWENWDYCLWHLIHAPDSMDGMMLAELHNLLSFIRMMHGNCPQWEV